MHPVTTSIISTDSGKLRCENALDRQVWRVGYAPQPWAWTPWQYAEQGRFDGRWDDPNGVWRTVYAGASPLVCYLEVLAPFRVDVTLKGELAEIDEDPGDADEYPTSTGGVIPASWARARQIGGASLAGWYALPGDKESLAALRSRFLPLAIRLHLPDVDAGTIRLAEPRAFTQHIAQWMFLQVGPDDRALAGVRFESRHGDDLAVWAVFERPAEADVSALLSDTDANSIDLGDDQLGEAMRIHRLRWSE